MAFANQSFLDIPETYLFSMISRRVDEVLRRRPDLRILRMGIGDVTRPLPPACVAALHKATDEMADAATFRGYGPEQGYLFLREAAAREEYQARGCDIAPDEIFVGDGSKNDIAAFVDLFGQHNRIGIPDPVYPVYLDSVRIAGFSPLQVLLLPCTADTDFALPVPDTRLDILYLCSPNNPTGTAMNRDRLARLVAYAREHGTLVLFDAAYEAYVQSPDVPRSIYEIPGARDVAVEFRSYSKTAGFTGLRCSLSVVPRGLLARTRVGHDVDLHRLWLRRQTTKFNGCPYIVQRAAEAVYTPEGKAQVAALIDGYRETTARIRAAFASLGNPVYGGVDAPYVWVRVPGGMTSQEYFDHLLERYGIVGTPGSGFGACGEGYIRFSGFSRPADVTHLEEVLRS